MEGTSSAVRQRVVATLVTLTVLAIVFWRILPRVAGYGAAWTAMTGAAFVGLGVLLAVTATYVVVYAWPLQVALPGLRWPAAFVTRQTSFMITSTLPGGGVVGLGVSYGVLASYGFAAVRAAAAISMVAVWNLLLTLAFPVLGVMALLAGGRVAGGWWTAAGSSLAGMAALVVVLVVILRSEQTTRRLGTRADGALAAVYRAFGSGRRPGLGEKLVEFRASTVDVISARWLLLTVASLAPHLIQFAILLVALRTLGSTAAEVDASEVFAAFALAKLATLVPLTPNGLGTMDAGLTGLLVAFGAVGGEALAAVLVWRAATTLPQIAIGIVTLLQWRRRQSRLRAARLRSPVAPQAA